MSHILKYTLLLIIVINYYN